MPPGDGHGSSVWAMRPDASDARRRGALGWVKGFLSGRAECPARGLFPPEWTRVGYQCARLWCAASSPEAHAPEEEEVNLEEGFSGLRRSSALMVLRSADHVHAPTPHRHRSRWLSSEPHPTHSLACLAGGV